MKNGCFQVLSRNLHKVSKRHLGQKSTEAVRDGWVWLEGHRSRHEGEELLMAQMGQCGRKNLDMVTIME